MFTSVHDMNMAMKYCDYVIALEKGKIVSSGKPENVLTQGLMRDLFKVETEIMQDTDGTSYIRYIGVVME